MNPGDDLFSGRQVVPALTRGGSTSSKSLTVIEQNIMYCQKSSQSQHMVSWIMSSVTPHRTETLPVALHHIVTLIWSFLPVTISLQNEPRKAGRTIV